MNPVKPENSQRPEINNLHEIKQDNPQQEHSKSSISQQAKQQQQQKQINYYEQFCKLYLANAELAIEKSQLIGKLHKLEKRAQQNADGNSNSNTDRKKRVRRSAADIARHYKCPHDNCSKSYGSEGSLNQHIKLKHPDYFKTLNIPESMLLNELENFSYSESRP